MNDRPNDIMRIRPEILSAKIYENMSVGERFQNETLRPIVKLQSPLFIEVFKNYVKKHKNLFYDLSNEEKMHYIENAVQKDIKFRNSLKGMVIGQFTIIEYQKYSENSSSLNKRMMNLVKERLISNMQLLERYLAD